MLAGWDHIGVLKRALSSTDGRWRRNRQLDSIRTFLPMLAASPVTGDTRTVSTTVSSHRRSRLVPARVIGSAMFCAAVERRNQLGRQDDQADMLTRPRGCRPGQRTAVILGFECPANHATFGPV
jgi:hypothetical protein